MRKLIPIAAAVVLLTGCATQVLETSNYKGYSVGQKLTAPVGGVFLVSHSGKVEKVKRWVGLLNSSDGWLVETRTSPDYLRKELVYGGVANNVMEISYREYRGGLAAPAFYQSVKYDLSASKTIVFQNFQIAVSSATNQSFEGALLRDH
jgi:hypothetical protein